MLSCSDEADRITDFSDETGQQHSAFKSLTSVLA